MSFDVELASFESGYKYILAEMFFISRLKLNFSNERDIAPGNLVNERGIWIVQHDMKMLDCLN